MFKVGDKVRKRNLYGLKPDVDLEQIHTITSVREDMERISASMYAPMRRIQRVTTDIDPTEHHFDWYVPAN